MAHTDGRVIKPQWRRGCRRGTPNANASMQQQSCMKDPTEEIYSNEMICDCLSI